MGGNNASFSVACGGVTLCRRRGQEKVIAVNADENQKRGGITLVTGVIGADTHIVGNRILSLGLEEAGFKVVSLGALTPADEFVIAAVETAADGIMVSSLYGQGELDCRGFRDLCIEAGLEGILLYIGGNLVVGKQDWGSVVKRYKDMGFDRAFPNGTRVEEVVETLDKDFAAGKKAGT